MVHDMPSDQGNPTIALSDTHTVELLDDALIIHAPEVTITLDDDERYKLYLLLHQLLTAGC